jgi:drug/metabolite transporter (DMT)-like permease
VSARAWVSFAAVSTLWGIPYLFIKVAVDDGVPPAFLAFVRIALGAAVLCVLAWRAGVLAPLRGRWRWPIVYALFEIAVPFPLIATGEQHVASSLAAIIIASVPLFVALLAIRFDPAERATGSRLAGLLMGLAGVVALVGIDVAGRGDELLGAGAILLAAVGYAAGPMVFKRKLADLDPRAAMGASLVIAAIALAPLAAVDPPTEAPPAQAIVALLVLGLFCTAAAFVFFGVLIAEVGPGRGLVITYIAPVVAVTLGVTVLGERPGAGAVAGLLLILAGSWLSTDGRLPPGLAAVVTRRRRRRGTHGPEPVERRSRAMNAPSAWTRYSTTAAGLRSSFASVPWRR